MKIRIGIPLLASFLVLSAAAVRAESLLPVTVTVTKLDMIPEFTQDKVKVIGLVEIPGLVPFEDGMSILDAIKKAGGLKGRIVVGDEIIVTSPSRKVKLRYAGISGSFRKEEWESFYASILIAKGDLIYVAERVL